MFQNQLHQHVYGKSLALSTAVSAASQIIETTAMLKLQQEKEEKIHQPSPVKVKLTNGGSNGQPEPPSTPSRVGPDTSANSSVLNMSGSVSVLFSSSLFRLVSLVSVKYHVLLPFMAVCDIYLTL